MYQVKNLFICIICIIIYNIRSQLIKNIFNQSQKPQDFSHGLTTSLRNIIRDDPDFFNIFIEGFAAARQSEIVEQQIYALYSDFRDALQTGLEDSIQKGFISPKLSPIGIAVILTALIDGTCMQLATDPELVTNEEIWADMEEGINDLLRY